MGFLAAFPAGIFTNAGGGAVADVSTGFMVFALAGALKLCDRASLRDRDQPTHFGMFIFFSGAAVWACANWLFSAAATL